MMRKTLNKLNRLLIPIISLYIVSFSSGCSGCSKSGRPMPVYNQSREAKANNYNQSDNQVQTVTLSPNIKDASHGKEIILYGTVYTIVDGDTYDLSLENNEIIRIRMEGIDSPEPGMPFSKVSKNYLGQLCFNKTVKVLKTGIDGKRIIGFTYLQDGTELSHEMIKAGMAWHYKEFNNDPDLARLEIDARNSRLGLWKDDNPIPPWEIRSLHKKGISTKNMFINDTN